MNRMPKILYRSDIKLSIIFSNCVSSNLAKRMDKVSLVSIRIQIVLFEWLLQSYYFNKVMGWKSIRTFEFTLQLTWWNIHSLNHVSHGMNRTYIKQYFEVTVLTAINLHSISWWTNSDKADCLATNSNWIPTYWNSLPRLSSA